MTIPIIILHYGKWEITKECLDSLLQVKNPKIKVIVVDNSLNRETQLNIQSHSVVSNLLIPEKNLGFAGGNNYALNYLKNIDDYVLFLNNDTSVNPDFLQKLLNVFNDERVGIAGPVIKHQIKGKDYYDYGGYIIWPKGQARHFNKSKFVDYKIKAIKRDFISGCCMLINRKALDKTKGFDKSIFMYLEDVDLCLRLKKYGLKTVIVTDSQIFHKGSQSITEFNKIIYSLKNSLKLCYRHIPKKYLLSSLLFNIVFYPSLFIFWQLKHYKKKLFK